MARRPEEQLAILNRLFEFSKHAELTIKISKNKDVHGQYMAAFENTHVRVGTHGLLGECGRGRTPVAAIVDYAVQITGKTLVYGYVSDPDQREIEVPMIAFETPLPSRPTIPLGV